MLFLTFPLFCILADLCIFFEAFPTHFFSNHISVTDRQRFCRVEHGCAAGLAKRGSHSSSHTSFQQNTQEGLRTFLFPHILAMGVMLRSCQRTGLLNMLNGIPSQWPITKWLLNGRGGGMIFAMSKLACFFGAHPPIFLQDTAKLFDSFPANEGKCPERYPGKNKGFHCEIRKLPSLEQRLHLPQWKNQFCRTMYLPSTLAAMQTIVILQTMECCS